MTAHQDTSSLRKRLLIWAGLFLGVVLACFILVIVLAPKVINRDAFRSKIESTISNTLGGTVTYDRLELVLFPQPDLEFRDLRITIPRAGSVTVDRVSIYAKLLPLLRGRFEVSSVALLNPSILLTVPGAATGRTAPTQGLSANQVLLIAAAAMPDLSLKIAGGRLSMKRDGEPVLSLDEVNAVLAFAQDAPADRFRIAGKAQLSITGVAGLPGPLALALKEFEAVPDRVSVRKARATLLDADASFSGTVENAFAGEPSPDISLNGSFGEEAAAWIRTLAGLPADIVLRTPVKVTAARLRTFGTGSARSRELTLTARPKDGPSVSLALLWGPARFSLEKFQVQDEESNATFTLRPEADGRVLSFSGTLTGGTAGRTAAQDRVSFGWLTGDVRVRMPGGASGRISAEGGLSGEQVRMPSLLRGAFIVSRFSVSAEDRALHLRPLVVTLGTNTLTMRGDAFFTDGGLTLDLDVEARQIGFTALRELMKQEERQKQEDAAAAASRKKLPIDGELRLRAASVDIGSYTVNDLAMNLSLGERIIVVTVPAASICGIGLDGALRIEDNAVDLDFRTKVRGGELDRSMGCVLREASGLSGPFDLSGSFTGSGAWDELLPSLEGSFEMSSKGGRIQSKRVVKGIIAYLNSTSMFKGSRSDLLEKGFPYDSIAFRGSLRESILHLSEATIRSKEVHITADGDVDLMHGTLALNVLAAPFTSLDRLLGKIPIVKYLAGNALIVVPARVVGTFSDPKVTPLPLTGVGTNVTNLMKNVVQAPVKIVDPSSARDRN